MSTQKFADESNWKNEPHSEHYVEDKFGKGTDTRKSRYLICWLHDYHERKHF